MIVDRSMVIILDRFFITEYSLPLIKLLHPSLGLSEPL
jgi:hypothetical protein